MDFLAGLLEPFHWQFMRNALLAVLNGCYSRREAEQRRIQKAQTATA